ncbi:MAG: response regulator [Cyanobacteria bacterium CRU_2_1]|nr:response regulator [Cyanobacteria bacterium RU_5_0]NJR61653.1 response regulator [Cyanobacteria bacterium CRU_2_1]
MNTISMGAYKPSQRLHPLSLLAQFASRQTSGCLQVSSGTAAWSIYLDQGKLVYASNSIDPFGRLDHHLRRLSSQVPNLVSGIRVQVRLLFEMEDNQVVQVDDYRAICWLVEQQHISVDQAVALIEDLAKDVIESFLSVQTGTYEIIEKSPFDELPKFCQLDLRPLVEYCQTQMRRRQSSGQPATAASERESLNQSNPYSPMDLNRKLGTSINSNLATNLPNAKSNPSMKSQNKSTYTIACIDDSPTVLQAINSFLDDRSFSVIMISDPVKALMQVIRNKPDLILLDVTMPNLDGYELCSLLRKHPHFKQTPIVMVTGNTGFIDRAKAKLVGASGYLTKPFTQSDLIKMVFKHLM